MSTATSTYKTQRAYELSADFGIDSLKLQERPAAELKPNEVRVKVMYTSLNYRDLLVIKGLYSKRLPFPLIPLSDGAGEVVEVGELVSRVQVGDRVAGAFMQKWVGGSNCKEYSDTALGGAISGMLADHVVLHEEGLVHIPANLSYAQAATLPCAGVTAWNSLISSGGLRPGQTILTLGTGGVSLFALQFAKMNGARVIITSSSDEKLRRAKEMGADEIINYKRQEDWSKAAIEMTDGVGVDHVVELGGAGTLEQSVRAVKIGGHISLIGVLAAGGGFNPMPLLMKNICLQGIYVGSRHMFEEMNKAIALHKLAPVIDKEFAFADVKEALKYMESGAHFGKIVIRVD
jgi:NADPH:quinone reductase-like Zn-dependent oxidoreductase